VGFLDRLLSLPLLALGALDRLGGRLRRVGYLAFGCAELLS
jgi:hypothetical protein